MSVKVQKNRCLIRQRIRIGAVPVLLSLLCGMAGHVHGVMNVKPDWESPMNPVPAGIPVAAGPVVLLCQVTQRQDNVRDAAELMQRNLGEFRTVIYDEEMDSAVRAQFQESLRGARLLCLDVGGWEALSESDRDDLRQRVEAGLDLMLTAPGKSALADLQERFGKPDWTPVSELWPGLRLETMTDVTMWRQSVGRGRVGVVRFPREAGVHFLVPHLGDRVIYNHGILATYAAMREVSGIKVPIRIVDIALTEPVEWESKGLTVPVSLQSAKSFQGTLDGYATNDRGRVVASARTELDAGEGDHTVELTLGPLPAGKYTVYAQVRGADATAVGVEIISPATLTIEPSQSLFSSEDPIQAALRVENAGEGDRLLVSVTDAWEREVARRDVPADTTDISLPAPLPRSRYQEVHATLMREGAPLRTSYAVVYRRLPHPLDEFQLFLWSGAHDRWWRNMHDARHAELGQNCAFSPGSGASYVRAAMKKNFELFSITHTAPRKKSPTQLADFASPEYLEENRKTLMEFAKESDALGGQWAFSHGDELFVRGWVPEVRDVSSGPAHDAFLRYLQDVYDNDIGSLNRAWGTAFASFEALEIPGDIDVPKEPRAPWLDYCFFLEDAFCGYFERLNSSVNEHYPDARFGIDGIEKFSCFDGINWPRLQASQDVMIIYPHIDHDNKLFSWRAGIDFRRPGTVGGFWMSYDSDAVPAVAGSYPWMALFHGLNSIGFFHSYATHDWYAALQHDWRPTPKYAAATASIREIQDGPDKLLLNATVEYSPIAIHYSSRSLALSFPSSGVEAHINKLGVRNSYRTRKSGYIGHTANAGSAFMNLLADAGHKPRFVSTEQIEDGALDNYKVLVLPLSQSLTDAEVKAIETFVRGGGLLLADYHCGVRDGRGNLRDTGALDHLFGLRQASTAPVHRSLTVSDFLRRPSVGASMTSFSLKDTLVPDSPTLIEAVDGDPEWTAPTVHGNADSGIPVCITRPVGDGLAVYLNFSVEPYLRLRHDTDGLPLRLAAQDIVQRLGKVTALADVVRTESGFIHDRAFDNLPEIGHQCHPFRDGALQYLGILWDYKRADWGPYDAEVRFNTPAHVYDVRAGRYHGFTDTVRMQVEGCPAKLFALLPYQVSGVSIDGPVETRPGTAVEFELAVRTDAETLGTHTLRMTVRDGDGNELPAWTETLRAPAGKTTYTMLPAFDQSGETLTLQVRDVATGATDSVKLEVR